MTDCGHIEEFDGLCRECAERLVTRCQWLEGMVIALCMLSATKLDAEKLLASLPSKPVRKA